MCFWESVEAFPRHGADCSNFIFEMGKSLLKWQVFFVRIGIRSGRPSLPYPAWHRPVSSIEPFSWIASRLIESFTYFRYWGAAIFNSAWGKLRHSIRSVTPKSVTDPGAFPGPAIPAHPLPFGIRRLQDDSLDLGFGVDPREVPIASDRHYS
jgi:hypothetical protein